MPSQSTRNWVTQLILDKIKLTPKTNHHIYSTSVIYKYLWQKYLTCGKKVQQALIENTEKCMIAISSAKRMVFKELKHKKCLLFNSFCFSHVNYNPYEEWDIFLILQSSWEVKKAYNTEEFLRKKIKRINDVSHFCD